MGVGDGVGLPLDLTGAGGGDPVAVGSVRAAQPASSTGTARRARARFTAWMMPLQSSRQSRSRVTAKPGLLARSLPCRAIMALAPSS